MILQAHFEKRDARMRSVPSLCDAAVIDLSAVRARRRTEAEAVLEEQIIQSVQHIDIVRLFELAAEREARKARLHT